MIRSFEFDITGLMKNSTYFKVRYSYKVIFKITSLLKAVPPEPFLQFALGSPADIGIL